MDAKTAVGGGAIGWLANPVGTNRYAYAGNDPVNKADPNGHSLLDTIKAWFKSGSGGSSTPSAGGYQNHEPLRPQNQGYPKSHNLPKGADEFPNESETRKRGPRPFAITEFFFAVAYLEYKIFSTGLQAPENNRQWDEKWRNPDGSYRWPDNYGFVEGTVRSQTWEKGTLLDRYGPATGRFLSPKGTPFEQRSLPPDYVNGEYHTYEVITPLPATTGTVAPFFGYPGGGIQL